MLLNLSGNQAHPFERDHGRVTANSDTSTRKYLAESIFFKLFGSKYAKNR